MVLNYLAENKKIRGIVATGVMLAYSGLTGCQSVPINAPNPNQYRETHRVVTDSATGSEKTFVNKSGKPTLQDLCAASALIDTYPKNLEGFTKNGIAEYDRGFQSNYVGCLKENNYDETRKKVLSHPFSEMPLPLRANICENAARQYALGEQSVNGHLDYNSFDSKKYNKDFTDHYQNQSCVPNQYVADWKLIGGIALAVGVVACIAGTQGVATGICVKGATAPTIVTTGGRTVVAGVL